MFKEITLDATVVNITVITKYIDDILESIGCTLDTQYIIDIVVDELFGNIAKYAYVDDTGIVTVRFDYNKKSNLVTITFIDSGIPFNPLLKETPDLELSTEEREIGGLGIYMVKKCVDDIEYEYKDGKNILTVKKFLDDDVYF
jgi:anti-sigma regulatory factor (Ser/Thr protein kinase)